MKVIPEQIIESCEECPHKYIPDFGSGCAINYQKGSDAIYDCPLKDYREDTWLDKPDSEGWWWYTWKLLSGQTCDNIACYRLFKDSNGYYYYDAGRIFRVEQTIGKWIKAIVPTIKDKE